MLKRNEKNEKKKTSSDIVLKEQQQQREVNCVFGVCRQRKIWSRKNGKKKKKWRTTKRGARASRIEDYIFVKTKIVYAMTINALCGLTARSVITCLFIIIIFMYVGMRVVCIWTRRYSFRGKRIAVPRVIYSSRLSRAHELVFFFSSEFLVGFFFCVWMSEFCRCAFIFDTIRFYNVHGRMFRPKILSA